MLCLGHIVPKVYVIDN